ncbi:MAG: enamine deaminase RidA [Cellvibrionaceae bacterium]|nr:enamine deaminase RidA [Cellvibrionaceae bacterium]
MEYLTSANTPAHLPFSEAVRVGHTVYLSGQIGLIPGTSELANDNFDQEARQVMSNIKTTLETHRMSMADLVKCTVMLTDIKEFGRFNQVYKSFFQAPFPARSAFVVKELALGAQVEVECIAALSQ